MPPGLGLNPTNRRMIQVSSLFCQDFLRSTYPIMSLMSGQCLRRLMVAVTILASAAIAQALAQQQPPPSTETAPIVVIPPAPVGLAAAPEELQKALDESALPQSVPALLAELARRADAIRQTIAGGDLGQVWVPAMATKTVALVLESHASALSDVPRGAAMGAIKQIVTSAWELDTYGDLGNREKLEAAYVRLATGVSNLKAAYEPR